MMNGQGVSLTSKYASYRILTGSLGSATLWAYTANTTQLLNRIAALYSTARG